ncbi:MAG: PadR family transcriptional regulator [Caldisericia bacterium]|jgi:DNA-binding PadR family transcriptional regulator|nr:PadR family transcriptional regulator [Caldisericia bacterium]
MKRGFCFKGLPFSSGFWLKAWILIILGKRCLHGYEIMNKLNSIFPEFFICKGPSHMGGGYRILRMLEEEGLIESKWETQESGPPKRVYWLTENGEKLRERVIKDIEKNIEILNKLLEFSKEEEV